MKLVVAEITRVRTLLNNSSAVNGEMPWEKADDGSGVRSVLLPNQTTPNGIKASLKIFVPAQTSSSDTRKSSRGLLLGSGGNTLRTLQNESKCRLTLKGKGSAKNSNDAAPGTDEEEDLYVLAEYEGTPAGRDQVFM